MQYEVEGEGAPCLVVAGVGAAWMRRALPAGLRGSLQLVLVEPPAEPATVEGVVGAMEAVRRTLDLEDVLVLGHSMNGLPALAYAALHPGGVRGVVAVATPPAMPIDPAAQAAAWARADPARRAERDRRMALVAAEADGSVAQRDRWMEADAVGGWHDWTRDTSALDELQRLDMAWLQSMVASIGATDWPGVFARVEAPVLLVLGESDLLVPREAWDGVDRPPDTTLLTFERSGHTPFVEEPEVFVGALEAWMAAIGR